MLIVEETCTGGPAAIGILADCDAIVADRRDVAHLTVQILDEKRATGGEGEASQLGVNSGDLQGHEDYKAARRKAVNGLCLAILRSTGKRGEGWVTPTSRALKSASVTISIRA